MDDFCASVTEEWGRLERDSSFTVALYMSPPTRMNKAGLDAGPDITKY